MSSVIVTLLILTLVQQAVDVILVLLLRSVTQPLAAGLYCAHLCKQVFANIAIIITSEESRAIRDWLTWRAIFHFVDLVCCCAILLPIVWSIKRLRDASQTDGKAARMLEKLTLFRQFYVIVVVFLYFTRIVVYLLENTLENTQAYGYQWIAQAANELATLGFYVWVGLKFRLNADNPYTKLHQEEVEMA